MRCALIECDAPPSHRVIVTFTDLVKHGAPIRKDYCAPHAKYAKELIQSVAKVPLTVEIAALA